MNKYWIQLIITLLIAIGIETVFSFTHWPNWLEKLAWVGEAITGIVAISALISFKYQVKRDRDLFATDLIGFFRKEIIEEYNQLTRKANEINGSKYRTDEHLVELEKFELWWLGLYGKESFNKQSEFHKKDTEGEFILAAMKYFNLLEEFSLKVEYMDLINHPALESIKVPYITSIEAYSVVILTYVMINPNSYPGVKKLYFQWKDNIDRRPEKQKQETAIQSVKSRIEQEKKLKGN